MHHFSSRILPISTNSAYGKLRNCHRRSWNWLHLLFRETNANRSTHYYNVNVWILRGALSICVPGRPENKNLTVYYNKKWFVFPPVTFISFFQLYAFCFLTFFSRRKIKWFPSTLQKRGDVLVSQYKVVRALSGVAKDFYTLVPPIISSNTLYIVIHLSAGYSEDSDYTSDLNYPVGGQGANSSASQFRTAANQLATPQRSLETSRENSYERDDHQVLIETAENFLHRTY